MVILLVVLTAITSLFISGSRSEVELNRRFQAQTEARVATDRIRQEAHCASSLTLVSASSISIVLPASCPTAAGVVTTVTYSTASVGANRYELRRNSTRIADFLTGGDVFSYVAPSSTTLGKLHLDLPVNVYPTDPSKQWRLQTDIALRNTTRS